MPRVTFLPSGQRVEVPAGVTLLEAYLHAGLPPFSDCAGMGTCGKCQVRFPGPVPPPSPVESDLLSPVALYAGHRLACQHRVSGDTTVAIALTPGGPLFPALEAKMRPGLALQPAVQRLPAQEAASRGLPIPEETIFFDDRALPCRPVQGQPLLGVALDIGTTTLSGYLLNLETGVQEAALALGNLQAAYGADVISRIALTRERPDGLRLLQSLCVTGVNHLLVELAREAGRRRVDVFHVVAVGNPTMLHLFLGVEPGQIAAPPFQPVFTGARLVDAAALGLNTNPWAVVETLPLVSGYVGADSVAMALFLRLDEREENCLAIDVGTNGEILLCQRGRLYACSAAAGPAFEGARLSCGMRAERGAIDSLSLNEGRVRYHAIGDTRPRGISGSGVVSAVASLLDAGLLLPSGRFVHRGDSHSAFARHLRQRGSQQEFVIARGRDSVHGTDVVLTQKDVRELQLAKAAIAAGIRRLLEHVGLQPTDVDHIYLAGAFGSHLDPGAAQRIGLLPGLPLERVVAVGNAAGSGAKMLLCSREMRQVAAQIASDISYLELSGDPQFDELFIAEMSFPTGFSAGVKEVFS